MEQLPRVTVGIAAAVQREIVEEEGDGYFVRLMEHLEQENPHLAEILSGYALQHDDQAAVAAAGLLVYRLLQSQLEADRLEREFEQE